MRRLIVEEPWSRSALWSQRLAWLGLVTFAIAALMVRTRAVELAAGAAALAAACLVALGALALALLAFARIWRLGHRGFGLALAGFALSILTLAYPAALAARAAADPPMADVVTDAADPPAFSASRPATLAREGWRPPRVEPGLRERQRAALPQLGSLTLELPEDVAFEIAREAAAARGLSVHEVSAPGGGRAAAGRIEASARTLVLRLPVEITVRVRAQGAGTRIDVRAVERVPVPDVGGARAAVEGFLAQAEALSRGP